MNEKKNRVNESYEKILEICHKKIQAHAQNQQVRCMIEVPAYIFGYPIFDYNKCIEFVYDMLGKNGFLVKYFFPKYLYVSWDFKEIESHKTKKNDTAASLTSKPPTKAALTYKPSGKLQLDLL